MMKYLAIIIIGALLTGCATIDKAANEVAELMVALSDKAQSDSTPQPDPDVVAQPAPVAKPIPDTKPVPVKADEDPCIGYDSKPDPARLDRLRGGFLWKPSSESDGRLVVLLPAAFRNVSVKQVVIGWGPDVYEIGRLDHKTTHNGCRPHVRFKMPGSSYGFYPALQVQVTTDTHLYSYGIPDPARRHDSSITPEVLAR